MEAKDSDTVQKSSSLNELSIACDASQDKKGPTQNPEEVTDNVREEQGKADKVAKAELASGTASEMPDSEKASTVPAEKASKPKADGRQATKTDEEMLLGENPSITAIDLRDQLAQELVKIAIEKLTNESGTLMEAIKFEYFQQQIKLQRPDLADFGSRFLGVDMAEKSFGKSELHLALGTGVFSRRGESSRLMRVAAMKYAVGAEVEVYTIDHSIPGRFRARILQSIKDDRYEIEYLDFKDADNDASAKKGQSKVPLLKEIVAVQRVRPKPPRSIRRFKAGRPCEAEWEDGWYEAHVLEEMNTEGKYKVRFCESQAELLLPQKKVRDLADWLEAEGKWVTAQRWDRSLVKSATDSAKKRKSKQNSKKQSTSEGNANSKNEDRMHSEIPEQSKTVSVAKTKRLSHIGGKEIEVGHKGEAKANEKPPEKMPPEKMPTEKSQDEMKPNEKKSNDKKPFEKKSNDKNPNNKKLNEKKSDEKKKVTPPKLGVGSGILAPYFKSVPGIVEAASRKPNFSSESETESNVPKSQASNKRSRASVEDSTTESGPKSKEPKANPNSKAGKGRTDTKNRMETVKTPGVVRPSSHQKEKRGAENKASSVGEQNAPTKEQRESSKKKATETEVQPSTRGTKRQRLSTSGVSGDSQQGRLDKKDQPSEKQLPTRATKKQKFDLPSATGEPRSSSKSRSPAQNPHLTSTPKRDGVESSKVKTKDQKRKSDAKLEEGRAKTGLELYKKGASAIGTKIKVFWDGENSWFSGKIVGFSHKTKKHKVVYDDGDTCEENLAHSKVELM